MAEKNVQFIVIFLHFMSIIWPCRHNNFKFNNGDGLLSSVLLLIIQVTPLLLTIIESGSVVCVEYMCISA